MRPEPRQIIDSIIAAIDTVILPQVSDQQAASSLRAARTLLEHLAARVEGEAERLLADTEDAQAVIGVPGEAAAGGSLLERNMTLQAAIDATLRGLKPAGQESEAEAAVRRALRAYLARRRARERPTIVPAFLGPPF